jgi:hypothetical protein
MVLKKISIAAIRHSNAAAAAAAAVSQALCSMQIIHN